MLLNLGPLNIRVSVVQDRIETGTLLVTKDQIAPIR
jgi:hypothetical protein